MPLPTGEGDNWKDFPIIENLIIDGQNSTATGIRLRNVNKCRIRNVTIRNCNVGILLEPYDTAGENIQAEANNLTHITMINVQTGIKFKFSNTDEEYDGSAAYSFIDDVVISLKNNSDAIGIQIGDGTSNPRIISPYSSFLRARVSLGNSGGKGMQLNYGALAHCPVNLRVDGQSNGYGIDLPENSEIIVDENQKFNGNGVDGVFLTTTNVSAPINNPDDIDTDIEPKP